MSDAEWRQSPDGSWWFRGPDNRWHPSDISPTDAEALTTTTTPVSGVAATSVPPPGAASSLPAGAWLAIIAGALAAIASLLPWVHFNAGFIALDRDGWQLGVHNGFSVDGPIVLLLGVVTIVIGIAELTQSKVPQYMQRSPIITGAGIAFVALDDLPGLHNLIRSVQSQYTVGSIGVGLWLAVAAGAVAIASGLILRTKPVTTTPQAFSANPELAPLGSSETGETMQSAPVRAPRRSHSILIGVGFGAVAAGLAGVGVYMITSTDLIFVTQAGSTISELGHPHRSLGIAVAALSVPLLAAGLLLARWSRRRARRDDRDGDGTSLAAGGHD